MNGLVDISRSLIFLVAVLIVNVSGLTPGYGQSRTPKGNNPLREEAQKALLGAFDRYELVGGMSPAHGSKDIDEFIFDLIRNPAFPDKVNDIAAECGNSLYQSILDRYIAGEDVPFSEAQKVWRNTTKVPCGLAVFYEELFPLVRQINQKLPRRKKLRVLACDPPIDWDKINSQEDMKPYLDRESSIASVIEKEILAKHRKGLLLFGVEHVRHGNRAAAIYERKYPNVTYTIADFGGYPPTASYKDRLEKLMAFWQVPSLVSSKGTWLADLDSTNCGGQGEQRGCPGIDGFLYLGPRDLLMYQPISAKAVLDKDYMAELQHRDDASGVPPNDPRRLQGFLRRESHSSVFAYDPDVK